MGIVTITIDYILLIPYTGKVKVRREKGKYKSEEKRESTICSRVRVQGAPVFGRPGRSEVDGAPMVVSR